MLAITDRRCEKRVMAIADRLSMPIQLTFPPCWRSVIAECMLAIFDRIFVCAHWHACADLADYAQAGDQ